LASARHGTQILSVLVDGHVHVIVGRGGVVGAEKNHHQSALTLTAQAEPA
jgi:hypothetical protein